MARRNTKREQRASGAGFIQSPWQQPENPYPPIEVLGAEQIDKICDTSYRILEEIGVDFIHEEAKEIFRKAGAQVEEGGDRVRIDRNIIIEAMKNAPSQIELVSRNPLHNIKMGGNHIAFGTVGSAPNASDIARGRRTGNQQDFQDFLKLAQTLNVVHFVSGYPVEPIDLHASTRHLDCIRDMAVLTDKIYHAYSLGQERITDALEITRIAHGCASWEEFDSQVRMMTIINTNSPLKMDGVMIEGAFEMARHRQLCVITPFTLSGAMSPVTLAGALAQQHAEALAGMTLLQLFAPGTPVMYGGFTSNVDMKSGAPAFGTPEYTRAAMIGGQLARRINIPYRSSNANASNAVDVQAAYESQMSIWGATMGHANMMLHGMGWLEGGLCASFEKFIIDAEMLQMMAEVMKPPIVDDQTLGLDAIKDVGPGGHFFGTPHTMERYETAFYAPMVSDWSNFENWQDAGSKTATERAHEIYKRLINDYSPPPIDQARLSEIDKFVARRKAEGGVKSDF